MHLFGYCSFSIRPGQAEPSCPKGEESSRTRRCTGAPKNPAPGDLHVDVSFTATNKTDFNPGTYDYIYNTELREGEISTFPKTASLTHSLTK